MLFRPASCIVSINYPGKLNDLPTEDREPVVVIGRSPDVISQHQVRIRLDDLPINVMTVDDAARPQADIKFNRDVGKMEIPGSGLSQSLLSGKKLDDLLSLSIHQPVNIIIVAGDAARPQADISLSRDIGRDDIPASSISQPLLSSKKLDDLP